eukprot:s5269_g2.t1
MASIWEGVTLQHELRVLITPREQKFHPAGASAWQDVCQLPSLYKKKTISLAGRRSRTYDSRGSGWQSILHFSYTPASAEWKRVRSSIS